MIGLFGEDKGIGDLILFQSPANLVSDHHVREAPGFHHLAFNAETRSQVDDFFQNILLKYRMKVLDSPCDCPEYSPGYYAVFFEDPDGMKLEPKHTTKPGFDNSPKGRRLPRKSWGK